MQYAMLFCVTVLTNIGPSAVSEYQITTKPDHPTNVAGWPEHLIGVDLCSQVSKGDTSGLQT